MLAHWSGAHGYGDAAVLKHCIVVVWLNQLAGLEGMLLTGKLVGANFRAVVSTVEGAGQ